MACCVISPNHRSKLVPIPQTPACQLHRLDQTLGWPDIGHVVCASLSWTQLQANAVRPLLAEGV